MVVPGIHECIVCFDASWHRRGHFSNLGFAAAIVMENGKFLDYSLYDSVKFIFQVARRAENAVTPMSSLNIGSLAQAITRGVRKQWKLQLHWTFGSGT